MTEPPEPPAVDGGGSPEPPPPTCAKCAAPLDADQTYCLECGEPTPLAPPLRPRRRRAALATAALLALGGGAGALAYAVATEDDDPARPATSIGTTPSIDTSAVPTIDTGIGGTTDVLPTDSIDTGTLSTGTLSTDTIPTDTFGTGTLDTTGTGTADTVGTGTIDTLSTIETVGPVTDTTTTDETTTEETTTEETTDAPTTTDGSASGASDWPAGRSGWTVQVASVRNRAGASRLVRRMKAAGQEAGLIFSSDYRNFRRPGYWVVFSGVFDDRASASSRQQSLGRRFGPTIVRRIDG